MRVLTIEELVKDTEREFRAVLGSTLHATSCETFGESNYRGGFELVLSDQARTFSVLYTDVQLYISFNSSEIFGDKVHPDFEGNMFSREHLREYLPRIVASVSLALQAKHAEG